MKNIYKLLIALVGTCFLFVEMHAATWGKPRAFTDNVEKLAELVKEKTDGEFVLSGLSKAKENLDRISISAFEMAQLCSFYHKDKNSMVVRDLARWNATLLMLTLLPQYSIVSKSELLQLLDEFKGLRIRGPDGVTDVLGKLGTVKTGVPFSEVRQAMESGVIDAASHARLATKNYKVGKSATTSLNLGSANFPVVVNTEALNSLSNKNKKALMGSVNEALEYYVDNYDNKTTGKYEKAVRDQKLKLVTFSE